MEDVEAVEKANPEFAKLLDVLSSRYQEDGMPKSIRMQLKQAELRFRPAKQRYLEQQLLTEELVEAIRSQPTPASKSHDSSIVSAELQHCLEVAPDVSLLGVQLDHLKKVAMGTRDRTSLQTRQDALEERLKAKCCRVAQWHAPTRDTPPEPVLQLARAGQLPQLLTQQKEEMARFQVELEKNRRQCGDLTARKHQVVSEMCVDLKDSLEQHKLTLTSSANQTSLHYLQVQSQAMLGKLDVMHHQLLKGICSDGRIQALEQIRAHLLMAQKQLTEELSQTQQVILSYHSLGEEFMALCQQYKELREEIENRQWALTELGKSHS